MEIRPESPTAKRKLAIKKRRKPMPLPLQNQPPVHRTDSGRFAVDNQTAGFVEKLHGMDVSDVHRLDELQRAIDDGSYNTDPQAMRQHPRCLGSRGLIQMAVGPYLVCDLLLLPLAVSAVELVPLDDGSPAQLTALGNESFMRGQFDSAIRLYEEARSLDNNYFFANYNALAYQEKARSNPNDDDRHFSLMLVAIIKKALRLRPDHSETLCNLDIAFRRRPRLLFNAFNWL